MEDVPAAKLLGGQRVDCASDSLHKRHFFSADNTHAVCGIQLSLSRVRILFIHIRRCSFVANQIAALLDKRAERHVQIADNVQRQAVEIHNYGKERRVRNQPQEFWGLDGINREDHTNNEL